MFRKKELDIKKIALDYEISMGDQQLKIFRKAVDLFRKGNEKKNEYEEKANALLSQELPEGSDVDSILGGFLED